MGIILLPNSAQVAFLRIELLNNLIKQMKYI